MGIFVAYNLFMSTDPTATNNKPAKSDSPNKLQDDTAVNARRRTYFGLAALLTGIIADLFIGANHVAAYMIITPDTFNQLNNLTALVFCILTPLTGVLGVVGYTRKRDSKILSGIAIALVTIPVLILFAQLVSSQLRQ